MSIWAQVQEILRSGQAPKITLSPGQEVIPSRRQRGRPRVRDPQNPFAHFATPAEGYKHPRCIVCRRRLKKNAVEVCNIACQERAMHYLSTKLARISGSVRVPLTNAAAQHLMSSGIAKVA